MRGSFKRPYNIIRIVFGLVWAIDAGFKWTPSFQNGLPDLLSSMMSGQPVFVADWIGLWMSIVGVAPHAFAILIALTESAIAIGLIFNILPRATLVVGFLFSLVIWSIGEGFGGPYTAGSTDIGCAVIYAILFAALWFWKYDKGDDKNASREEKKPTNKDLVIKGLSLAVIILAALLIAPYIVIHTSTAQQTDMPPGMVMKAFYIGPLQAIATDTVMMDANMAAGMNMNTATTSVVPMGILASTTAPVPTVFFTIVRDTLDGWDLHVTTTNFTWTPQNINQAPVADEGHAHLYIDGALTVLFGPWYHIPSTELPPGKHEITVSLNANDHSVFSANGQNVQETQALVVGPI